jgi:hypothetical protein
MSHAQNIKDNTERSLKGNLLERVTTEAQVYGSKTSMTITGRFYLVTSKRECGGTRKVSIRDSLDLLATRGVEVNSTQPHSKKWSNKYDQDLLEQMQRQQDLVWKRLIDASATAYNDSFLFNTFTPTVFASMQNQVMRWGIPVHMAVISFDIWPDIIADTEFSTWFDPVSKHEIVANGYLGNILGTALHTDGFKYDTLKVLEPGEVYFLGAPANLGAITRRKDLATAPINLHLLGRPERGWFAEQIEGMAIVNPRAAVKGRKF